MPRGPGSQAGLFKKDAWALCEGCHRALRPRNTPVQSYPASVQVYADGMCRTCYMDAKYAENDVSTPEGWAENLTPEEKRVAAGLRRTAPASELEELLAMVLGYPSPRFKSTD